MTSMTRSMLRTSRIAVPLLAVAALLGSTPPASAATGPYGFTILDADSGNMVHTCKLLGGDKAGYQAVVCVNITTGPASNGYWAEGSVEAYCQTETGIAVACAQMQVDAITVNGASGSEVEATYACNVTSCPDGRETLPVTTYVYTGGHDCTSSAGHDMWAEILGQTTIWTGSGEFVVSQDGASDGSNYSSGHYWICP
jgi:hypothetical protein